MFILSKMYLILKKNKREYKKDTCKHTYFLQKNKKIIVFDEIYLRTSTHY